MLLFIYDDDEWGYFYYDGDMQKDSFSVCPREGMEELELEQLRLEQLKLEQLKSEQIKPEQPNASAEFIAKQFHINVNEIVNYYRIWTDELIEDEQAAYEDDEYTYGDCWQIADFMRKLGFPFPEGDEPEPQRAVEISGRDISNQNTQSRDISASQNAAVTQNNIRTSSESENGTKSFDYASATAYVGAFDYEYGVILLETYKSRLRDIIAMLECGKYRKAREELTRRIDNVKNNCHSEEERKFLSGLYVLRGSCSRILGNSWNAGRDLEASYELEPENIYILRQRIQAATSKERLKRVIQDLNTLMRIDMPNYDYYLVERAWRYYRLGELDAARSDLTEAKMRGNSYDNIDFTALCKELGV